MKIKRYVHIVAAMIIAVSTIIVAPVSHATGELEALWPTPAIAADPTKSGYPQWVSANGQYVAMSIRDQNNQNPQSWLLNRATGQGELLESSQYINSVTQLSEDLRYMIYEQQVSLSDIRPTVKDRSSGTDIQLGINTVTGINQANSYGAQKHLSKNGTKIVFSAKNFQNIPNIPADVSHIYVYDTQTQSYTLVDDQPAVNAYAATISGNGRYVLYEKFDIETQQGGRAMYRKDLITGEVVLVGTGSFCYSDKMILSDDGSMAAYNCRHGSKLVNMSTQEVFPLESSGSVTAISDDNATFLIGNKLYLWETKAVRQVSDNSQLSVGRMSGNGKKLIGTFWVYPHDGIGNTFRPIMVDTPSFDETPPSIEPHLSAVPDANGWNNAPVTLTWSVADPDSDISQTSGCEAVTVGATTGATYTCAATSGGGTTTESITVRVDITAPVVTSQLSPLPNAAGWNNTPTTLTWNVSDLESPVVSPTNCDPVTIVSNTASTSYTCTATSSGGTANQTTVVKFDSTVPTISAPGMSGGLTLPFLGAIFTGNSTTISATVADGLSGVARAEYYFDTDPGQGNGASLSITNGSATATASLIGLNGQHTLHVRSQDQAGNWSAIQSFTFRRVGSN